MVTFETMKKMQADVKTLPIISKVITAGGSAQNTMRFLEWTLRHQRVTAMIGMVGNDEAANIMRKVVINDGVMPQYIVHEFARTGINLAIAKEEHRTLMADIGACSFISVEHIQKQLQLPHLSTVDLVYICGFLLVGKEFNLAKYICDFCIENDKMLLFNLSSVNVINIEVYAIRYVVEHCHFLFGNYREFESLRSAIAYEGTVEEMCAELSRKYPHKIMSPYGKVVLYTHGGKFIFCTCKGGTAKKKLVPLVEHGYLKDSTGAGDAFVAGFICAILKNQTLEVALEWAVWTSQQIIQGVGVTLPKQASFINQIKPIDE